MVQSVPLELNLDHSAVLQAARARGFVTRAELVRQLRWEGPRATAALEFLEHQGMAWIDDKGADGDRAWYFPSLKAEWVS